MEKKSTIKFEFTRKETSLEVCQEIQGCKAKEVLLATQLLIEQICRDANDIKQGEDIPQEHLANTYKALSKHHQLERLAKYEPTKQDIIDLLDLLKKEVMDSEDIN